MKKHVVITCALTGAGPLSGNPAHPVTPQQIARAGIDAARAGAAILHVHVRDPQTGEASGDLALYEEVVSLIRAENQDVILNLTTGLGSGFYPKDPLVLTEPDEHETLIWSPERRFEHVSKLKPEICTLDLVTGYVFGGIVMGTPEYLSRMAALMQDSRIKPEIEIFDSGDLILAFDLIKQGVIFGPGMYSFVMGLKYKMPANAETMLYMRDQLPQGAHWQAFGIGKDQFSMAVQSVLLGGHARVGLEDNVYSSKGVFSKSNAEQVLKIANFIQMLGSNIATPQQARDILGISRRCPSTSLEVNQ
jgi:uncharacterized protein (DUF849 family)